MNAALLSLALVAPAAPADPATPDMSENVAKGLKWLAGQQKEDGSWVPAVEGLSPTPITAMAGLAFLMEGSTLKSGTYAPNLRKAVAWFEKNAKDTGLLATHQSELYMYMPNHAAAITFLASVYDVDDDEERSKRLAKLLDKAVSFAVGGQTTRGGWGFVVAKEGSDYDDAQTTATVVQALFAARKAGFDVPRKVTDKGTAYLVKATNRDGSVIYSIFGNVAPMGNDGYPLMSAAAAVGVLMADGARPDVLPRWVGNAAATNPQYMGTLRTGGSYALWQQFQMARVSFTLGDTGHRRLDPDAREASLVKWSAHRPKIFKALKDIQGKDGSWPDQYSSPAYSTAMALVILQLDNNFLPAFSR